MPVIKGSKSEIKVVKNQKPMTMDDTIAVNDGQPSNGKVMDPTKHIYNISARK